MGNNHKQTKSRANAIAVAWDNLAKDDSFGGLTLAQFQQLQADTQAKSSALETLNTAYAAALMQRDTAHAALGQAMLKVVDGVKGDTTKHGADSSLYKAMGYVPRSERASGLTRKKATTTATSGSPSATTYAASATWSGVPVPVAVPAIAK